MKKNRLTREDLLEIGIEMAREVGFSKITIRSFAKKANIAVGTVYYYFKDKTELIEGIIESYWKIAIDENIEEIIFKNDSFIGALDQIYLLLYRNYSEFHSFLTKDLGDISNSNNSSMNYHLEKIRKKIEYLLYKNPKMLILIEEVSTIDDFLDYVIDNIFSSLKRNKKELGFLKMSIIKIFNLEE